jgi:integrase
MKFLRNGPNRLRSNHRHFLSPIPYPLPLFARHEKGTGKKIKPITPTTGRTIVAERVRQALVERAEGHITPHSFRHYFVSTILRSSGNLKLAQALARHENIQITQRYAHINDDELDKGYYEIFEKKIKQVVDRTIPLLHQNMRI